MKKVLMISAIALVFAAVGLLPRSYSAPSFVQETITGDWTAKVKQTDKSPVLWLSLNYGSEGRKGGSQMSCDFPLQAFAGLNPNANGHNRRLREEDAGPRAEKRFDQRVDPDQGYRS